MKKKEERIEEEKKKGEGGKVAKVNNQRGGLKLRATP